MGDLPVMLRAWWRDHQATPSWCATAGVILIGTVFALTLVPTWGSGPALPLWALVPGTVSMLQAPAALSQLGPFDRLQGTGRAQVLARAAWALLVAGASALACLPLAHVVGQPAVTPIAGLLVLATFALSVPAGLAASLLGATVDVLAFTYASRVTWFDVGGWLQRTVPGAGILAGVLAAGSIAAYALLGPRSRP